MKIIGHRGAKGLAPENTIAAIKAALNVGVDAIELDVRLHNKHVVLAHDATVQSNTYTLLAEALTHIHGQVSIVLEIKEERVVKKLKKIVAGYNGPIVFSSKLYSVLHLINEELPDAKLAVIEKWSGLRAVAEASLLDTTELHINHTWLWGSFVRSLKYRGYTVYAYTVNNPERAAELEEWGVDGIITDYPNRFLQKAHVS